MGKRMEVISREGGEEEGMCNYTFPSCGSHGFIQMVDHGAEGLAALTLEQRGVLL